MSALSTLWEVRCADGRIESGLTAENVAEELYRGRLQGDEWARASRDRPWRPIVLIDEFDGMVAEEDRRRTSAAAEDDGMDMTPMIDVTFLLLIFFMVTASFHLQKGLDFPTDKTESESPLAGRAAPGLESFDDRLIVEISESDEIAFKPATGRGPPIARDELVAKIQAKSLADRKGKLLIVAHEMSSHEATVAVIDAAAQAGVLDVAVADITTAPLGQGAGPPKLLRPVR